jgi:NitT/TauT family transport system ATP-binding protein
VLELRGVGMSYAKPSGEPLPVLTDITVTLRKGEILGLLGRSGSGKSTLLRIAGGLVIPTSGTVLYRGSPLTGPAEGIAIVFQTFALFPWLNVLENVEAGLVALGLPREEIRERANRAIDLIGLDGFESAYPRELSGGMRQRVGFARALVIDPALLLMDEPFSALDVLTAENLRTDFIDLWTSGQMPTDSVLLVTHNIEEALLLCDRILILSSRPARITEEIPVALAHPRNRHDPAFVETLDRIYTILTSRAAESVEQQSKIAGGRAQVLPPVSIFRIDAMIEMLAAHPHDRGMDLATIVKAHALKDDDVFSTAEVLHILEFGELTEGSIRLTAAGRAYASGVSELRERLFKEHLLRFVPLAAHICQVLSEREGRHAPRVRFESELEDHLTRHDAEQSLRTVIGWGRYAELFDYDDKTRAFVRPNSG